MIEEADERRDTVDERRAKRRRKAANLAHTALNEPPKRANGATILVLTFVAFVLAMSRNAEPVDIAIVVGVLLLHESGHLVGMWAFGFSDLRMFFLPFLGAAVSGRKPGASAVVRSIVSLLGPVPGIVVALVAAFFVDIGTFPKTPLPVAAQAVVMLVLLNGFNLVPVLPLDGGRLFQVLLFGRVPVLDVLFRIVAIGVLGWVAWRWVPLLGVPAVFLFVALPYQARIAFEAARLRTAYSFPTDVTALGDEELVALHDAAERALSNLRTREALRKRNLSFTVREIFDRAAQATANWWQTGLLLLVWLLAIGVGAATLFVMLAPMRQR